MQVNSQPNKFKIFQDYYLYVNGEMISYSEALRLYSQLDNDTMLDFEQFYKDETGYEIISASGYNLNTNTINNLKTLNKANINTKYTIDAYAKKSGKILDPQWSGYSAEEIMQMVNNGVNVPQDIVDLANTILQTSGTNVEGTDNNSDEGDDKTEKEPYLDLIPKAKKKIEKCNETNEKINDKIDDLLPEKTKFSRKINKIKDQKKELKEFEEELREWRTLQNKVNNGEALSDKEAKRYAQITGMLQDKNNKDDIQFDKNEIARSLNDINILAVLGEKLADETIEIGDTLADYTSKANYKMTAQTVSHEIGFIGTIMAMAQGKTLAKEASKVGNDTKEYSSDTSQSVGEIAGILGVKNSVLSASELKGNDATQPTTPAGETQDANTSASNKPEGTVDNENEYNPKAEEETKAPEITTEEDFIVNDDNVKELIKEGKVIRADLLQQIMTSRRNIKVAKNDAKFAKYANFKITRIVKQYQDEETKREEEIAKLEKENEQSKDKLEKLTGKSGDELDKEINNSSNNQNDTNNYLSESDKKEIEKHKTNINNNNQRIEEIKQDSENSIQTFKQRTTKEKARITTSVPEENDNIAKNQEYIQKTIPADKEALNFTGNTGVTLNKMGKYRVIVGLQQIATWEFKKGYKNLRKGRISMGIGSEAQTVANPRIVTTAEKMTDTAISTATSALEGLNKVDGQISSITGEETTQSTYDSKKQESEDKTAGNAEEGAQDTADGTAQPAVQTNSVKVTTTQKTEGNTTGAAAPVNEGNTKTSVNNTVQETSNEIKTQANNATKTVSDKKTETPEEKDNDKVENKVADATTSTSSNKTSGKKEEMTNEKAQDNVDNVKDKAKDSSKDSENVKKDTDKTTKELEKETKKLTKQMKKDEKEIIKMTKESQKAAKKQDDMVAEYEAIVAENEQLTAEDTKNQQLTQTQSQNQAAVQTQAASQTTQQQVTTGAQQTTNSDKIASNDARLNTIGVEFEASGRIITRNRTKIVKLQKTTKTTSKKVEKKTKVIEKKNKESEKAEQDKQKKLAKQLGVVGVAENVFSTTLSIGSIMMMSPWPATIAAGAVMVKIGTYGVAACGVTKGVINLANGNLTAALMSIGQAALTVATSQAGVGQASGGVLGAVTAGLNVVSSSADMVNNIRAVQGKEASGVFSKISAIAGAASAVTSAASTLGSLGKSGTFGQISKVSSVVGSALSSTSQLMTSFGDDSKLASILGTVGGAISTAASIGMLADSKMNKAEAKNEENKDNSDAKSAEETNKTDNTNSDNKTEQTKEEQKQETEKQNAQAEIKKAEQTIKTEENKDLTDNTSKSTEKQVQEEKTPKEKLQAAKDAREAQKATAEDAKNNLDKIAQKNMTENGASLEYANISDDEIAGRLEFAQEMGDDKAAAKFSAELEKRGQYKEQMAVIAENKEKKAQTFSNITNAVGSAVSATTSIMNMNNGNNNNQSKKKTYVAGKLTKRSKEIIAKNRKRIAALAKKAS